MPKARLSDLSEARLRGALALVRVDLNVPIEDGEVADDTRIEATLPTLRYLAEQGARVVAMSHLGRPKGVDPAFSLAPVARRAGELLGRPVGFVDETVGPKAKAAIDALGEGEILLLENTRFLEGETENDPDLAAALAGEATLFVQDAFGTAHRAHASTQGAPRVIRERGGSAVSGLLLASELKWLGDALEAPERPFVAVLGGAKISGKIDVVSALLPRVDKLLIGGAMANTFWLAQGRAVGTSLVEPDRVDVARALIAEAGDKLVLPSDARVAPKLEATAEPRVASADDVRADEAIGDIGPETERHYAEILAGAKTIVWNGPMGIFEMPPFAPGTLAVAHAVADATDAGAIGVLGGGDSAAAAAVAGVTDRLSHVSTGGGASLSFLAGEVLPGVEVLDDAGDVGGRASDPGAETPIVAGNWKMHLGPGSAVAFADAFAARLEAEPVDTRLLLFPSAVALSAVAGHRLAGRVGVGAQTVHSEPKGAFTGELAAEMAAEAGATWSLVGHSERRHVFGEDDEAVAARAAACLRAGLRPMVCVGETLEERRSGRLDEVLRRQVEAVLSVLGEVAADGWAIAYEPVWAIGTGETASPADAEEAHALIAQVLTEAGVVVPPILYGGSVKPANAEELIAAEGVDGVLVGGASLDPADFHAIARAAARVGPAAPR